MLKSIQLKLASIKYANGSIGNDICVEVEALGKLLRFEETMRPKTLFEVNREIGIFETDRNYLEMNVKITVVEKDIIFNDVGTISKKIKIDLAALKIQKFLYGIEVKEARSVLGVPRKGKSAIFEVTLEASAVDTLKCVPDNSDGWLRVILDSDNSTINLPAFLEVKINSNDGKREHFTILEGSYRGKNASVILKENSISQFVSKVNTRLTKKIIYSISNKAIILDGKKYKAADYSNAPWQKGFYDIEIPDYPHSGGSRYQKEAPRAKTWFRIGHQGEKYLHTGRRSLGCITITELQRWAEIYNVLIKARKNDFVSVGVLEVVE
jgi:hypothetical protein